MSDLRALFDEWLAQDSKVKSAKAAIARADEQYVKVRPDYERSVHALAKALKDAGVRQVVIDGHLILRRGEGELDIIPIEVIS